MQSKRLQPIKEYYFSTKLKEIASLVAAGKPIINLGIGSPDLPPHPKVIARLAEVAQQNHVHAYQSYRGIPELRKAIAGFYQRKFGVASDFETEILPLIGSKEGIMHISMAFLNQGDEVLIPRPGYMTYRSASLLTGASPVYYDLDEAHRFLPDLDALQQMDLSKVKLMWLNYPHMPTGAQASLQDFAGLVDFAKQHQILLVNDNPYSFILNEHPVSILQVPEAKDVALELNSLSKSHNMAGWRVGWLMGSQTHIDAVMKFKSQMDSGMFYPLQQAAVTALALEDEWYQNLNRTYSRRKKWVLELVDKLGLKARKNQVGMFVWAQLPEGISSKEFTDKLLYEKHIFLTPGFIFGDGLDGYVRISLTVPDEQLQEVLRRV